MSWCLHSSFTLKRLAGSCVCCCPKIAIIPYYITRIIKIIKTIFFLFNVFLWACYSSYFLKRLNKRESNVVQWKVLLHWIPPKDLTTVADFVRISKTKYFFFSKKCWKQLAQEMLTHIEINFGVPLCSHFHPAFMSPHSLTITDLSLVTLFSMNV